MSDSVRILPSGPHAFLAEYTSLDAVLAVAASLRADPPAGLIDLVPAARTILVVLEPGADEAAARGRVVHVPEVLPPTDPGPPITVEVRYDGDDLRAVGEACGMSADDVIAAHSAPEYAVAFCGFMPGFSYLTGLDRRLHMPRRPTPRTRVPAGSVAIAGEYTAVYPSPAPGGWHLVGTTDAVMWDGERPVPALLPPGARVRFVAR
jgi:KipI family sensor histidine kinase inhibitor